MLQFQGTIVTKKEAGRIIKYTEPTIKVQHCGM